MLVRMARRGFTRLIHESASSRAWVGCGRQRSASTIQTSRSASARQARAARYRHIAGIGQAAEAVADRDDLAVVLVEERQAPDGPADRRRPGWSRRDAARCDRPDSRRRPRRCSRSAAQVAPVALVHPARDRVRCWRERRAGRRCRASGRRGRGCRAPRRARSRPPRAVCSRRSGEVSTSTVGPAVPASERPTSREQRRRRLFGSAGSQTPQSPSTRGTPPEEPQPRIVKVSSCSRAASPRDRSNSRRSASVVARGLGQRSAADLGQLGDRAAIGRLVARRGCGTGAR